MQASVKAFNFIKAEGKIIIPYFQRSYVWDEENWSDLFYELTNKNKENNFLGPIILKQLFAPSGESKKLEVIDGQQRLTTLFVLLKAIYDSLDQNYKNMIKDDLDSIFYCKTGAFEEKEIRIDQSKVDREAFCTVIKSENLDLKDISKTSHKVLRCYKFFIEKLCELSRDDLKLILDRLLYNNNKMFIVIDLESNEDEQHIFDVLNTAGVKLTAAEVIKNYLFRKYIELSGSKEDTEKFYTESWEKIFISDEETHMFWNAEVSSPRLRRTNLELLLYSIAVIYGFFNPKDQVISELSKSYKRKIDEINELNTLQKFIERIVEFATIYKEEFAYFDRSTLFSFGDQKLRLFHILQELKLNTFHPFILYLFKKYKNNEEILNSYLNSLEKIVVRNMLSKKLDTRHYSLYCLRLIKDEREQINNLLKEVPFDDKVEDGLKNLENNEAKLILFWIELFRRHNSNCDIKELKYDYSLEHIMPKKWQENWNFDAVPHPKSSELDPEKQELDRKEKIKWIGNMTLLRSKLNSTLKNYSFEKKMKGEGNKKGIKDLADLMITREDIVKPYEDGDKIWNEKKIEERTKKLTEEVRKIWG